MRLTFEIQRMLLWHGLLDLPQEMPNGGRWLPQLEEFGSPRLIGLEHRHSPRLKRDVCFRTVQITGLIYPSPQHFRGQQVSPGGAVP